MTTDLMQEYMEKVLNGKHGALWTAMSAGHGLGYMPRCDEVQHGPKCSCHEGMC